MSEDEATAALLRHQADKGGHQRPSGALTRETSAGWAFFNGAGYLGTVTSAGEVVVEEEFADALAKRFAAGDYELLPRPRPRASPQTLEGAYRFGLALGRLGLGLADYAEVTALTPYKDSWWKSHFAGWRHGRRAGRLPKLTGAQVQLEYDAARRAS